MTEELAQVMSASWSGPTEEKQGFTYLPWDAVMSELNSVFGWENVNVEVVGRPVLEKIMGMDSEGNATKPYYGYSTHVRITIVGPETAVIRDGIGFNELTFTNVYKDKDGNTKGGMPQIDVALKGSASNAIVRAAALLGVHFGLDLYRKDAPGEPSASKAKASSDDKRPSEKQNVVLLKKYSQSEIDAMPFAKWKGILDSIFSKTPATASVAASRKPADDYDF